MTHQLENVWLIAEPVNRHAKALLYPWVIGRMTLLIPSQRLEDGWFRMGDLVQIDPEGWLTVTGRVSDFIIRGGKNISAVAIEGK